MNKTLLSFIGIITVVLFSAGTAIVGVIEMISSIFNHTPITQGLELFFLGSISFSVTLIAYTVVRILSNTQLIANALASVLEIIGDNKPSTNSLDKLFGGMFSGSFPTEGRMQTVRIDEDGNIHPIGEQKEFNNPEEFLKFRDELINDSLKSKPGKKSMADMTIEELDAERIMAEEKQDYNLAAMFRDLINEKKNKK